MAFPSARTDDIVNVGAGERWDNNGLDLSSTVFEDGLYVGRFVKLDTGSIDNLDSSATPVIAGITTRDVARAIEDSNTIDAAMYSFAPYRRYGLVTVAVKSGETAPAKFGAVYASNTADANAGLATSTGTDLATNAIFIEEVKSGVWLVYLKD